MKIQQFYLFVICLFCIVPTGFSQGFSSDIQASHYANEMEFNRALIEGTKEYILKNYENAIDLYGTALGYKPLSGAVNYQISQMLVSAGEVELALPYARKAYQYDPKNKWYGQNLINVYQNLQNPDMAIDIIDAMMLDDPANAEYIYIASQLHEMAGNYGESMECISTLESMLGFQSEFVLSKYRLLRKSGSEQLALNELKNALPYFNDDYTIVGTLARHYQDIDHHDSSRVYYQRVIPDYLNIPEIAFSYGEFLLDEEMTDSAGTVLIRAFEDPGIGINLKYGFLYRMVNEESFYRKAESIADTLSSLALFEYPENIGIQSVYADVQNRLGNYNRLVPVLKRIIETDASNFTAWEQLIFAENILNRPDSVIKYAMQSTELFDGRPFSYYFLGAAYAEKLQYEQATHQLEKGISVADDGEIKFQLCYLLGECYYRLEDHQKVWMLFDEALRIKPSSIRVRNTYAYYLAEQELRLKEALRMSEFTLKGEYRNVNYYDTYAWVLFKMNKRRKAKRIMDDLIDKNNITDTDILVHYGDILYSLKRYEESIIWWNHALEQGADSSKIILSKIEKARDKLN